MKLIAKGVIAILLLGAVALALATGTITDTAGVVTGWWRSAAHVMSLNLGGTNVAKWTPTEVSIVGQLSANWVRATNGLAVGATNIIAELATKGSATVTFEAVTNALAAPGDAGKFLTGEGAWAAGTGGGWMSGTVSNAVVSDGLLAVDDTKTNAVAATAAMVTAALGFSPQPTNANLTSWAALAPSAKQDASANLAYLADNGGQPTNANLTSWAALAPSAKQDAFTTGEGVTNVANVLSAHLAPGANVTFTTNAYGVIEIAASGGGAPSGTLVTNGQAFAQYQIPQASDATGTNVQPSALRGDATGTNISLLGALSADSATFTNTLTARGAALTNAATDAQLLILNAPAGASNVIKSTIGGVPRWALDGDPNAVPRGTLGYGAVDNQLGRNAATKIASGESSVIGGGTNNTASGSRSTVAGGNANTASGTYSTVAGGDGNTASGTYAVVAGGYGNTASTGSTVAGGSGNTASGSYGMIPGGYHGRARLYGQMAMASTRFGVTGDAQTSWLTARRSVQTNGVAAGTGVGITNAWNPLFLDGDGGAYRGVLPYTAATETNALWVFRARVAAFATTNGTPAYVGHSGAYEIEGAIKRIINATTMLAASVTTIYEDNAAWDVRAVADDTSEALVIEVYPDDACVRAVATIELTEVTKGP